MSRSNLIVNVIKKESAEASASTPVSGITVYFDLYDKGYELQYEKSANTNSIGMAYMSCNETGVTIENWSAHIYWNERGITTGLGPITENNKTITVIEPSTSSTNTWETLSVFVGINDGTSQYDRLTPVPGQVVNFSLSNKKSGRTLGAGDDGSTSGRKKDSGTTEAGGSGGFGGDTGSTGGTGSETGDSERATILTGITNRVGYATIRNDGNYNDVAFWSANTTYENVVYTTDLNEVSNKTSAQIEVRKGEKSADSLLVYTKNERKEIVPYSNIYLFFYDAGNNLIAKVNGISDSEGAYKVKLTTLDNYTSITSFKINAAKQNVTPRIYCITYGSIFESLSSHYDQSLSLYVYDAILRQQEGFRVYVNRVNSYDLLTHNIGGTNVYVKPWNFDYKSYSSNYIPVQSNITNGYYVFDYYIDGSSMPYFYFRSTPTVTIDGGSTYLYSSGVTTIYALEYPTIMFMDESAFNVGNVNIYCPKTTEIEVETPVILDTVSADLDSPVFNLPNVTIRYDYYYDDNIVYTTTSSSNTAKTTFSIPSGITGGIEEFLLALAGRSQHGKMKKTLSKHHYNDNTSFVFLSAATNYYSHSSEENSNLFYYFCKFITDEIGNIIPISSPQRYWYIEREENVCYPSNMFNDYVKGFAYKYTGNVLTAIGYVNPDPSSRGGGSEVMSDSYPIVSAFSLQPYNKLVVSNRAFYSGCSTNVSPIITPEMSSVNELKTKFVKSAITRPEYGTIHANKPSQTPENNDYLFDINSQVYSAHAYTEHLQSFWPEKGGGWNYLEFYPIENTTGSVTLNTYDLDETEITKTLQISYWGGAWEPYKVGDTIHLYEGTNVRFRNAENVTSFSKHVYNGSNSYDKYYHFDVEGDKMCVKGNLASLVNVSGMSPSTEVESYSFVRLFEETKLYGASGLTINLNSVAEGCFYRMFRNCKSLQYGPKKITTVYGGEECMGNMFNGCSEMQSGPVSIGLRRYETMCCIGMFADCEKLVYAPLFTYNIEENALGSRCFEGMFLNCYQLREPTSNPNYEYELANIINEFDVEGYGCGWQIGDTKGRLTVAETSCYKMFQWCWRLKETPIFQPLSIENEGCAYMFSNCLSLEYVQFTMPWTSSYVKESGCEYMFEDCHSITTLTDTCLSATTLYDKCYFHMFDRCFNLHKDLPLIMATRIPASGCAYMYHMCYYDTEGYINQFITQSFTYVDNFGMAYMFQECRKMDFDIGERNLYYQGNIKIKIKEDEQHATSEFDGYIKYEKKAGDSDKRYYVYVRRYEGSNLENICIGTTEMYGPYYEGDNNLDADYEWVYDFKKLYINALAVHDSCYSHMFNKCEKLHYANNFILPAKILANKCYEYMFSECGELFSIPIGLSGITSFAASACQYMFAYDGDFKPNNKIMNKTPNAFLQVKDSEFPFINATCGETETFYHKNYYIYKKGLRSIQTSYNYLFYPNGKWAKMNVNNPYFAYVNSSGDGYNSIYSISYNLVTTNISFDNLVFKSDAYENANNCFSHMFYGCKGLSTAKLYINNNVVKNNMFMSMFNGCYSLTDGLNFNVYTTQNSNVEDFGCFKMFKDCHELINPCINNNILQSLTVGNNGYAYMYNGCYKLITGPQINALYIGEAAMAHMFNCCYRLKSIQNNILPSTSLSTNCYAGMFYGCFSLQTAPGLPATTLPDGCYSYMFAKDCLYYYTGSSTYRITAKLENYQQQNVPSTANGRCTLSEYNIKDNTDWPYYNTTFDISLMYFGNYFYKYSYFDLEPGAEGSSLYYPGIYDKYFIPYGNLGTSYEYFREDTEFNNGYELTENSTEQMQNVLDTYFTMYSRNIITPRHFYTWYKGNDVNDELYVDNTLFPTHDYGLLNERKGVNPVEMNEDGFYNEKYSFDSLRTRIIHNARYEKNDGTIQYEDLPCIICKSELETKAIELDAKYDSLKSHYVLYKVCMRYEVNGLSNRGTSTGYSLDYHNDSVYKENKKIRATKVRLKLFPKDYHFKNFYIPVNDRCAWNQSLNKVTISANSLTTATANAMFDFLSLTNGNLYAPGSSSNYNQVLPNNWSVLH